ncbi:MAG: chemotaxis protein CheB [Aquabacterium sp.]|nr:chemotaxis protein CheB [Aquabacterium sp.]
MMPVEDAEPRPAPAESAARVRVVGIGASAGGLDALGSFLAQVPADSGLAFTVVQHLDPLHKAMLAELLQRTARVPVQEAADRQRIQPNQVYVIPPNKAMTVAFGMLQLSAPTLPHGLRRPIDVLFESLANEYGEGAVGVVLSGMGSDGTTGLQAIKARGGLTLAQAPESAQFDAMPRSAIAAGCVDIVCEAREMPQRILAVLGGAPGVPASAWLAMADAEAPPGATAADMAFDGSTPDATQLSGLSAVLELLRLRGKHDFRLYKHSTLLRRMERRMGIHRLPSLHHYEQMLRGNPQELDLLFKELLIGVTAFFRDTPVWQAMQEVALPQLLHAHADGDHLRAWVAGCSTGEEAYSLAMAFREVVDASPDRARCTLQIFATDLSRDAIERARRAVYPLSIAGEVSPGRLARFFSLQDSSYRVDKSIRETIVFAPHDLTVDPPFTKLDLLCCRNLLIYLTAPLQRRLLPLFHYSLLPDGVLMLGTSETVGRFEHLFEPLDIRQRLYRRRESARTTVVPEFPLRAPVPAAQPPEESPLAEDPNPPHTLQAVADQLLLQALSPPAVLVDERGDIVYINGHTGKYLEPAAGKANWNIHVMAREGLRLPLQSALQQVDEQQAAVSLHALPLNDGTGLHRVDVSVHPLSDPPLVRGMRMIVFRDVELPAKGRRRRSTSAQSELETELQRAREEAQALREEMRASQEELQASNEELQSTNEELTSSKEEMQSMNEELQAVNAELQSKLDDLALAQSDMRNLLNSTDIATLFVDKDLNVRRFTERARKIISLRDTDIGRPLSELATSLEYPGLRDDVQDMLRTMVITEREIHSRDGQWYAVRVMPYRTQDDVIQGAVITFVDITTAKALEARLRQTHGGPALAPVVAPAPPPAQR